MPYNISTFQAPAGNLTTSGSSGGGGFGAGGAMATMAVMSAITSIFEGRAMKAQADINARMYEQQAGFIQQRAEFAETLAKLSDERYDISRDIEIRNIRRAKSRMTSTLMANVASSGLDFSGSPVAVMLDNLTEYGIDEEITKYNYATQKAASAYNLKTQGYDLQMESLSNLSKASQSRYEGKQARTAAYSRSFSTLLKGGVQYKLYKEGYNPLALK